MAKSKKIVIFLSEEPYTLYEKYLKESMLNASGFIISLLTNKEKESMARNPVGRPKIAKETDMERLGRYKREPKDVLHPKETDPKDMFRGFHEPEMVSLRDAEEWCAIMDIENNDERRIWAQSLPGYIQPEDRIKYGKD